MINFERDSPWGPSASLATLKARGEFIERLRHFLRGRGYWEVQTPVLSADTVVDAHIDPIETMVAGRRMFLQTSPEFAMKRLLAAGSGSIFQVGPAFRSGELGPLHNPEFLMAEWYRVGGGYEDLMTEVGVLAAELAGLPTPGRITYREAFLRFAGFDPFSAGDGVLVRRALSLGLSAKGEARDDLLDFLLAVLVEPGLRSLGTVFLYDFPASQAALARVRPGEPEVAERFELYAAGVEICNGYQELTDAAEWESRARAQNQRRGERGMPPLPTDSRLLEAMRRGLPECAGVALGVDRLFLVARGENELAAVLPFSFERA